MNKQNPPNGIEWTRVWGRPGYTWNPTAGCMHGCTWRMPDGSVTECYAKTVAERLATKAYPEGFEHHYWRPRELAAPKRLKEPAGIFAGSMADLFGHWVPSEQIGQVLEVMAQTPQHVYMTLTKNPLRLMEFIFPKNAWVGVSLPAGQRMPVQGASRALAKYLEWLQRMVASVRFMSFEPLWFNAAPVLENHIDLYGRLPFEWAIIGAASLGARTYQPQSAHLQNLLGLLDLHRVPVFFKGNLDVAGWFDWREDFPAREGLDNSHSVK